MQGIAAPPSATVLFLTEGVLRMLWLQKLRGLVTLLVLGGLVGLGIGLLGYSALAGKFDEPRPASGTAAPAQTDEDLFQGTWLVTAAEEDGNRTPADKIKKAADDPNGPRIIIEKDRLSFVENGKSETVLFKLDSAKKPRAITFFDPRREDKPE